MAKPNWKTLIIFCACLCSFALHNSVFYGIDTSGREETLPLVEARGEPDSYDSRAHTHAHTHEHEDEMTSLGEIAPHVLIGLASRVHSSYLSTLSHTLIPLLPPPISQ